MPSPRTLLLCSTSIAGRRSTPFCPSITHIMSYLRLLPHLIFMFVKENISNAHRTCLCTVLPYSVLFSSYRLSWPLFPAYQITTKNLAIIRLELANVCSERTHFSSPLSLCVWALRTQAHANWRATRSKNWILTVEQQCHVHLHTRAVLIYVIHTFIM